MDERGYASEHCGALLDVVRGSLQFSSMSQLHDALILLQGSDTNDANKPDEVMDQRIEILRVKNRFKHPTSGGWADVMLNFRFVDQSGKPMHGKGAGHVCEIQLIHEKLLKVRGDWGAHAKYSKFRTSIQLLEAAGRMDIVEKVDARTQGEVDADAPVATAAEADVDEALAPLRATLGEMTHQCFPAEKALRGIVEGHHGDALAGDAQKIFDHLTAEKLALETEKAEWERRFDEKVSEAATRAEVAMQLRVDEVAMQLDGAKSRLASKERELDDMREQVRLKDALLVSLRDAIPDPSNVLEAVIVNPTPPVAAPDPAGEMQAASEPVAPAEDAPADETRADAAPADGLSDSPRAQRASDIVRRRVDEGRRKSTKPRGKCAVS